MTRLKAFDLENVESSLKEVIKSLTPYEKLMLYDCGLIPERFSTREAKELRHLIPTFTRMRCTTVPTRASSERVLGKFGPCFSMQPITRILVA